MEESFLVGLSTSLSDPAKSEMPKSTQLTRSDDPYFCIIHKFFIALLARQVYLYAPLQLVTC